MGTKNWLWLALLSSTALPAVADEMQQVLVTASRLGEGLTGAEVTTITSEEIAADPAADLPQILSRQAGAQLQSLYGGVDGAQAAISLRGFGATATENTLVLVNGRRINDPDQSNIDFAAIPTASIERIEILRGNSAAVLYGDGATGGVINIVTKNGANSGPGTEIESAFGSYQYRSLGFATNQHLGGTSLAAYGSDIVSNGYRDNNALRERNFDAEIRRQVAEGELYLNVRGDDQHLGFPGAIPLAQWQSSPKSTNSPFDYGDSESINAVLGGTGKIADGILLVVDAGIRHKEEQSEFQALASFSGIVLTTASVTPRINFDRQIFDLESKVVAGIDYYQTWYRSFYSLQSGAVPYQNNLLGQSTYAVYGEDNVTLSSSTGLGFGVRLQQADVNARQKMDFFAPGYPGTPGTPLRQTDNEYAAHLGLEQNLGRDCTLFLRAGHAMRLPNMDDRNYVVVYPTNFALKTQTSEDVEAGFSARWGWIQAETRVYAMNLHNEIDYDPGANGGFGANVNLDPTRRMGSETEFAAQIAKDFRVTANVSLTDAVFRQGPYKGLEVPQVAHLTGNIGAEWTVWRDYLILDGDLQAVGRRKLGDDDLGQGPQVPGSILADLKLGGRLDRFTWSVAAHNLFNTNSYQLGYYSAGAVAVYPLAGRDVMARLGVGF
jgi:iron complex outermembrane receptor protein